MKKELTEESKKKLELEIDKIINDPFFQGRVNQNLSDLLKKRRNRPAPPKGKRYVRDWYDRMSMQSHLSSHFFLLNIKAVWLRQSSLHREEREVIGYICDKSLSELMQRDKEQMEATEKAALEIQQEDKGISVVSMEGEEGSMQAVSTKEPPIKTNTNPEML